MKDYQRTRKGSTSSTSSIRGRRWGTSTKRGTLQESLQRNQLWKEATRAL